MKYFEAELLISTFIIQYTHSQAYYIYFCNNKQKNVIYEIIIVE